MEADLTPPVSDDKSVLAGAIVVHARKLCENVDYLRHVLSELSIPTQPLTDHRQTASVNFDTESMARVYLYQTIYISSRNRI